MSEWRGVMAFALHAYPLLLGERNNRLGVRGALMMQYGVVQGIDVLFC